MPDRRSRIQEAAGRNTHPQFQLRQPRTSDERHTDDREILQRFLIICEGTKTEPNYFQGFRVPQLSVDLVGTGRNTLSLVEEAIRLKEEKEVEARRRGKPPYDQIWCVFDRDSFEADKFNNAIKKAEVSGFHVAYTNQAFELWYLLHFDDHRSALNRSQYAGMLEIRLRHEYQKNSQAMYAELQSQQAGAIRRAENLLAEYGASHNPQQDNPSTTVHLLVKALRENVSPRDDR